ncbi:hypothetical protein [Frondihabitans sucicola]|uniref:hypothetical protein n=1 Tax=Frondihabitans sucicola TaxID=1268041 RepID=UPI002573C1FB|nr:hypothetical protein [Frondihabitans sucicola]
MIEPDRALRVAVMSFAHTHAIGYLTALRDLPGVEVRGSDPDGSPASPEASSATSAVASSRIVSGSATPTATTTSSPGAPTR